MKTNQEASLGFKEKLGYGLGDTASNFFFQTFSLFLLYYYTDVVGLSAAAVGTMFFVAKLWNAINDPMMGAIADRTQSRHGKFRPYLLWMAVPYGFLGFLMFSNPEFGPNGKLVFAWVSYILMMTCYTAINVPYSALMAVMTPSSRERTILSSYRFVGAFGGGLLISMLVRPLIRYFGAEDEEQGFRITMALFAIASIALFWFTFATTRERVQPATDQGSSLRGDLRMLVSNRPWTVLCFAGILTLASVALKNAVTIYYFKYYVMDDGSPYFLFFDRTSLFMSVGMLALIAGVMATKFFADRFEKRTLMIGFSTLNAASMVVLFFVPPDMYALMMVVNIVGSFLAGPTAPLVWAMYADVSDYGEWKFGRRTTGLVFSAAMFAQKFGLTIGSGLAGWLLAGFGFVANESQSDSSVFGIRMLFTLMPACFAALNVCVLFLYSLRDSQVAQIEKELAERKLAPQANPSTA